MQRNSQLERLFARIDPPLNGPYLEVGSKDYGHEHAKVVKEFFASSDWVGVDLAHGPGVDVVCDLTADFDEIDSALGGKRFGTIFCFAVLEHCEQPFKMAENLTRLLRPDGRLCIGVPFAFKVHAFPSDYWRFTPDGVRKLFPHLEFDPAHATAADSRGNEFKPLDERVGRVQFSATAQRKNGHPIRALSVIFLKLLGHVGIFRWFTAYRYLLAPTNICMIGKRKLD